MVLLLQLCMVVYWHVGMRARWRQHACDTLRRAFLNGSQICHELRNQRLHELVFLLQGAELLLDVFETGSFAVLAAQQLQSGSAGSAP